VLVEVSLEGDEELHDRVVQRPGSWRKAVDGIRHLVRLRREAHKTFPKFDVKLVVTKDTVPAMTGFMHLGKSLGVDLVNFMAEHDLVGNSAGGVLENLHRPQAKPQGVDPAQVREQLIRCFELERESGVQIRLTPNVPIEEFVRHYSDHRELSPAEYSCDGPWSRIGVTADGRYGPMCPYAAYGDMRKQSIHEVWNGERYRQFRLQTQKAKIYAGCNGCCNLKYIGPRKFGLGDNPAANQSTLGL
jgi:MoaA/NifB/PqqE/SkfB family radical SAM enzyme